MRKAFRHTGVLMMLGVVALGLIGAAYTLWYEQLTLEANITTGTFDVDWSCHDLDNPLNAPGANLADCSEAARPVVSLDAAHTNYQTAAQLSNIPNVASKMPECNAERGGTDGNLNNGGNETLSLTLHNLYPYAGCEFWLDITNTGTVPAHVKALITAAPKEIDGSACGDSDPNPCLPLLDIDNLTVIPVTAECDGLIALDADGLNNQTWTQIDNGQNPLQLHEGNTLRCRFIVALDQANVEGSGIHLTLQLFWFQWNENPAQPPV